jgi:type II secretory pathway component PulK
MSRERGIALIQVLLIAGIIGLLMMQLGLTAREQVARATRLDDRATLELAALSRETALIYTLLTEPWVVNPDSANPYAAAWNFSGRPFTVDEITFTLQDESGRLRVPLYGAAEFADVVAGLGVDRDRARRLGAQLMDLQGASASLAALGSDPGNGSPEPGRGYPLQDLAELKLLPDMSEDLYLRLRPLLTLYPTPGFNPMTAPPELLRAQLSDSQLRGLADARDAGEVDMLALMKITGVQPDEMTVFSAGPALELGLRIERGDSRVERRSTIIVRPYQSVPVAIWQRSGNEEQGST